MPSPATQRMMDQANAKLAGLRATATAAAQPAAAPQPPPAQHQPPPAAPAAAEPELLAPPPLDPPPRAQSPSASAPGLELPADPHELDPARLQNRIRTIEGVLEAERRQSGERERRLIEDRDRVQQQLDAAAAAQPPADIRLEEYFTEEEIAELGADVLRKQLQTIDKLTTAKAAAMVKPIEQRLRQQDQRRSEDEAAAQRRRQSEFLAALTAAIPTWAEWASADKLDPRFHRWLDDSVYGHPRHELLAQAQARLDAPAVIQMLKDFLQSLSKGTASPKPNSREIPDGRPAGQDPPPPPSEYDFTESQVAAFRDDIAHGRYRGRGKEMLALDSRIREARLKGRIKPGV